MRVFIVFAAGLLFGLGLTVSAMIDPAKVLAFLDIAGDWDSSLAVVMACAIPVAAIGFRWGPRRGAPPAGQCGGWGIDARLVAGAVLFGVGWGLAGYCPGPGLVALGLGRPGSGLFVASILGGMALFELLGVRRAQRRHAG
ncbi:DUF6691 family protein [Azospirillum canadense]|uniref:DUF6691 family protein n=1 Tax=Azospirillum canadense TaxID=403962 RepID=UPI002227B25D|nr:DUF6691 family protein [Azospirillum canadense]MCW2237281.1 putative membrane protein YedE/YeeE [Azospirillum canadense]